MKVNFNIADTDMLDRYLRIKKKDNNDFIERTLAMTDLSMQSGVYAIVGRMVGDQTIAVQSYMFDKNNWTTEEATRWAKHADETGESLEKAMFLSNERTGEIKKIADLIASLMEKHEYKDQTDVIIHTYADLKSIIGVEIFQEGTWNGENYSMADLQDMVNNFADLKTRLQPYVKLGHDDNQALLQKDGMPAAGWIDRIYIQGKRLVADIVDMPSKIYDLVKNKAYKRVSSEVYWNLKGEGDKIYKRVLKAVSLLGGDTPAIGSLQDVTALYTKRSQTEFSGEIKKVDYKLFTEGEVIEMDELKEKIKTLEAQLTEKETEIKKLSEEKLAVEQKFSAMQVDSRKKEIVATVESLISKNKLTPAEKDSAIKLFEMEDQVAKTYSDGKFESVVLKQYEARTDIVSTTDKSKVDEKRFTDESKKLEDASKSGKSYAESRAAVIAANKEVQS